MIYFHPEGIMKQILESIHIAVWLPIIFPSLYVIYEGHSNELMFPLYFAGWCILPCCAVTRIAARRLRSLWSYLVCCLLFSALPLWLGYVLCKSLFRVSLLAAFLFGILLQCLWITIDSGRIRMREKDRQRAQRENDSSWRETFVVTEHPQPGVLLVFTASYLAGLFGHSPQLCDLALFFGIVFLILLILHRQMMATDHYLQAVSSVSNVPGRKIRRLRTGIVLFMLLSVLGCSLPSLLTRGLRTYPVFTSREIRQPESSGEKGMYEPVALLPGDELRKWAEMNSRQLKLPEWTKYLGPFFLSLAGILAVYAIVRIIIAFFLEFRGTPEENGDKAEALDPDDTRKLKESSRLFPLRPLSERERIRRNYRRTIRRFRSCLPSASESPEEIERAASFPEGFDRHALHESYEQARYRN